ncbi:MAG: S8 family serine peptidase [Myxococcota bacterium]
MLRFERAARVARLGESAELELRGSAARSAECRWAGGHSRGPRVEVPARDRPGSLDVRCEAAGAHADGQVTWVSARRLPVADPYAGAALLLKLHRRPRGLAGPAGSRSTGLVPLDRLLVELGAWALPAFPFDRSGTRDRVGIGNWIAVDLPPGVHFYQAVERLRALSGVYAESYLPLDAQWFTADETDGWPEPFEVARRRRPQEIGDHYGHETSQARDEGDADAGMMQPPTQALRSIGAERVGSRSRGDDVIVAVVDTGVDVNHAALEPQLRVKSSERQGNDVDGNGIPGDELGVDFAHLVIAHGAGAPYLALGRPGDLADWHAAADGRVVGHGTAIAGLIAGRSRRRTLGVAPAATLLAIDIEQNRRPEPQGPLLADEDPRLAAPGVELRRPVWSRAAGLVYAAAEGARVATCGGSDPEPYWIVHDALRFAEDNCVVSVCAAQADRPYPARWRDRWLRAHGQETGPVLDAWTGAVRSDLLGRPLRGLLLVTSGSREGRRRSADLWTPAPRDSRGAISARSQPRDDRSPRLDRRLARFAGPLVAVGMTAGVAALVTSLRPDLDPLFVAESLLDGARAGGRLDAPGALASAADRPLGGCQSIEHRKQRLETARKPWWRRVKLKARYESPSGAPASPDEPEEPTIDGRRRTPR